MAAAGCQFHQKKKEMIELSKEELEEGYRGKSFQQRVLVFSL